MLQRSVDFNLASQFLTSLCSGQIRLGHDLKSPSLRFVLLRFNRLDSTNFVAFGEATLAEVATSHVLNQLTWFINIVSTQRFFFLFNDLYEDIHNYTNSRFIIYL